MENERRDEEFTIVLNRWHICLIVGEHSVLYAAPYQTFAGALCPYYSYTHLQKMILVWEHTFYHHDNSPFSIPFSIIHAINEKTRSRYNRERGFLPYFRSLDLRQQVCQLEPQSLHLRPCCCRLVPARSMACSMFSQW